MSLRTEAGYEITSECDFSLHTPEGTFDLSPGSSIALVDHLRVLLDQTVTTAIAEDSGALSIKFFDGNLLWIEPDESYEAWNVTGPHGMRVVCMPGGHLAVWNGERC